MSTDVKGQLQAVLKTLSLFGKGQAAAQVQKLLLPHIMRVFSKHDHTMLENMILIDYDLVEEQTPPGVRNAIQNLGSNPELRQQWEQIVVSTVRPENILVWMRNPDEWLDEEEADELRDELQKCAKVIEETDGGYEWLERQVLTLYKWAQIVPEDSTLPTDNN